MTVPVLDALESISAKLSGIIVLQTALSSSCKSISNPEEGIELISKITADAKAELDQLINDNQCLPIN